MIRWLAAHTLYKKRVLVRVDFNVPLRKSHILDDFRIKSHLPTIKLLLKNKNTVILLTHIGKPGGKPVPSLSAKPVAERLSRFLQKKVTLVADPFSVESLHRIVSAQAGSIFLLENVRFWPGEEKNDAAFAKKLSKLGEAFVQDAFGEIHRPYATMIGIPRFLPSYGGLLLKEELDSLRPLSENPKHPFVMLMGGAKISTKLPYISGFLKRADTILLGGGLANTVLKAEGLPIGKSLFEKEALPEARRLILKNKKLLLPKDVMVAASPNSSRASTKLLKDVGTNDYIFDIGPQTRAVFVKELKRGKTILWNGPLGLIEKKEFSRGTLSIAQALKGIKAYKVIGGGDLLGILRAHHLITDFNHIATGGGATLALIAGHVLPGIEALKRAKQK